MHIVLKGYYGFGNLGDDILLKVSYELIKERFPISQVSVFSNNRRELNGNKFNHYIFNLLQSQVQIIDWNTKIEVDLVFNGGGGLYFDRKNGPYYRLVVNTIITLLGSKWTNRIDSFLRKIARKPLGLSFHDRIGVGIGIEKFTSRSTRFYEKLAELGSYRMLLVRDEVSKKQLERLRFQGIFDKFSDLAFLSSYWKPNQIAKEKNVIGVVLMQMSPEMQSMYSVIQEFALKARANGYTVLYFSFDEEYDEPFYKTFPNEKIVVWRPQHMNLNEYLLQLGKCEQILTSRAHGAILGACMGCIPICFNVSSKLSEVSRMFPNSARLVDVLTDGDSLFELIEENFKDLEQLKIALAMDVAQNTVKMRNGIAMFDQNLGND